MATDVIPKKIIIAGSRTATPKDVMNALRFHKFKVAHFEKVVCGEARGADTWGRKFAERNAIPVASFPVTSKDWETLGKSAGHLRNAKMADYADAAVLVWDGQSKGTRNMFLQMRKRNKPVYVYFTGGVTETIMANKNIIRGMLNSVHKKVADAAYAEGYWNG